MNSVALWKLCGRPDAHDALRELETRPQPPDGGGTGPKGGMLIDTTTRSLAYAKAMTKWTRDHPVAAVAGVAGIGAMLAATVASSPWSIGGHPSIALPAPSEPAPSVAPGPHLPTWPIQSPANPATPAPGPPPPSQNPGPPVTLSPSTCTGVVALNVQPLLDVCLL